MSKQQKINSELLAQPYLKWLLVIIAIFLIVFLLIVIFALNYDRLYRYQFFPGVKINGQSLKGQSHLQAMENWQQKIDDFVKNGLKYKFNDQTITIFPTLPATDPDVSYQLINFNLTETIDRAYLLGRAGDRLSNFQEQWQALLFSRNLSLDFDFHRTEFLAILKSNLDKYTTQKREAHPRVSEDYQIDILPESTGTNFDYDKIMVATLARIYQLSSQPIELQLIQDKPEIKKSEVGEDIIKEMEERLASSTLTLVYEKNKWPVYKNTFKDWLAFKKEEGQVKLALNQTAVVKYLEENIKDKVYRPTLDAKFEITDGRVEEFQASQDGWELDLEGTLAKLQQDFIIDAQAEVELTVKKSKAKISTGSLNDLGIVELLGSGHSNFQGSPQNRRHNIRIGADSLNGVLIKPGETFSLIEALGDINKAAGYLPELVIKGDKTIPEYGGGLCQIGTTVFRAALATGLPIDERRNHSYRVSYYEPAGKDATIYDPWPDFKFTNDTQRHILIQYRIQGDDIYFDFWGTSDGRVAEQTDSVIYNIKSPGGTIYIETEDLAPGEKRCTESAHAGADAYFDYKVTYPDGEIMEERFTSHYIPWPAKCLIGKDPSKAATSTEEVILE